jgi:lipid II:glycine glycyltransferase (peptidoglycan interpeptide bridge formation enzyme)
VDRATSAEWSQMLDLFDDANIYQTAAYGEIRWGKKNLSRLVLKLNGEVVGMAQLRIIRPTPLKFGMAYLRWGPIWERQGRPVDPEVPERLADAIEKEYLKKRKLFVHILPNAFAGSQRAELFGSAFSGYTTEGVGPEDAYRTFLVDLRPSLDELRKGLDPKWRNKLKQAERNGLTVISGHGMEEFRAFCEIYSEMRKRKSFESTVDAEEFGRIQATLEESERMHVLICQQQGVTVAAIVASAMGDSAIYLLGATSDAGLSAKGAYLLQWTMIAWLKERGIKYYDLGGIDPERNPGVFYFKRGFSGADTCQINPLSASDSTLSTAIAKVGLAVQRRLRASHKPRFVAGSEKQPAAVS